MSTLTPELGLVQAVDADDTADYLTLTAGLAGSLAIVDGLFNSSTGHTHSGAHQGGALGAGAITTANLADGSVTTPKIADGAVTAAKLDPAAVLPEALFANTSTNQGADYTVAATIMWVFCTAAITVTLPAAASSNRPITVAAVSGQSTVVAASGSVIGGSINTSTGAVQNGVVSQGDSVSYRSDGSSWRAV